MASKTSKPKKSKVAKLPPPSRERTAPASVPIHLVRTDGLQMRAGLDAQAVDNYAHDMRASLELSDPNPFPPVHVYFDGELYWLSDGHHRLAAAVKIGLKDIEAIVTQGTKRDALLAAVGANASHGLPRNNVAKRRAVETLLNDEEWGAWSNNEIARRAGVSHPFVAEVRRILKPLQDAPRKVQRNGVVFEQNTAAIGRKAATSPPPPATTTDVLDDVAEDDLSPEDDDVFPVEPAPADEEFDNPFEDASPAAAPPPPKPAASKPAAAAKPATAIKADGALDERATAFNAPLLNTIKRLSESAREIRDAWGLVEGERNLKEWSNEDARDNGRASYVATIGRINDVIYAFRQTLLVARGDDGRGLTAADVATAKRQAKLN